MKEIQQYPSRLRYCSEFSAPLYDQQTYEFLFERVFRLSIDEVNHAASTVRGYESLAEDAKITIMSCEPVVLSTFTSSLSEGADIPRNARGYGQYVRNMCTILATLQSVYTAWIDGQSSVETDGVGAIVLSEYVFPVRLDNLRDNGLIYGAANLHNPINLRAVVRGAQCATPVQVSNAVHGLKSVVRFTGEAAEDSFRETALACATVLDLSSRCYMCAVDGEQSTETMYFGNTGEGDRKVLGAVPVTIDLSVFQRSVCDQETFRNCVQSAPIGYNPFSGTKQTGAN